jgi:hypothetical protein
MDAAYISTFAALAGSAIGGLTSLANAWLVQHAQARAQQRAQEQAKREELYGQFIDEASKLFADALQHQTEEVSTLVGLYALLSRIRLRSSPQVTERAEQLTQLIIETYLAPNKTFYELPDLLRSHVKDPFLAFSEACHKELRTMGSSRQFV